MKRRSERIIYDYVHIFTKKINQQIASSYTSVFRKGENSNRFTLHLTKKYFYKHVVGIQVKPNIQSIHPLEIQCK
jgi:hypothetical protein